MSNTRAVASEREGPQRAPRQSIHGDHATAAPVVTPMERMVLARSASCACGGGCPRCAGAGSTSRYTVNTPGDRYEQEADRIAEQVMRMPEPGGSPVTAPSDASGTIQRAGVTRASAGSGGNEQEIEIQAREEPGAVPKVDGDVGARIDALRGGGQPLSAPLRSYFEPRFGHDFSGVRIHTDAHAADTARAVRAQAYTIGGDIVFGAGQYAPGSDAGRRLLAHELVHTIQQGAGRPVRGGSLQRTLAVSLQRMPERRIQRVTDATFEASSGVGPAITAGTMTTDASIHGQTFTASDCFGRTGCNITFQFAKAYKGDYNYVAAAGRTVRGVYVKIISNYSSGSCGPCNEVRLLQVYRYITQSGGTMQTDDPRDPVRRTRAGWGDPAAPSRGWGVDRVTTATVPYYTSGPNGQVGSATTPAILWDSPGEWSTTVNRGIEFLTCAICSPSSGASHVLGCVRWGFHIDNSGVVTFRPAAPTANCGTVQQVTDATQRWDAMPGNTAANIDFANNPPAPPARSGP